MRAGDKPHPGLTHEINAALHDALVEFHVRDAVHQQAADTVGTLVYGDLVAHLVKLIRSSQAGRAGADDSNLLTCALGGRLGGHPALLERAVNNRVLDILDGHRRIGDAEHARAFARRGAYAAGELREIVSLVQAINRLAPAVFVDEMIPLGDEIIDRATGARLAERHPAIHAARALRL